MQEKKPSDVDEHIHEYSTEWTIDVPATCTSEGSKSHHCKNCDDKIDVTKVDKVAHNYSNGVCAICGENEIEEATGLVFTLSEDESYYIVTDIGTEKRSKFKIPSTYIGKPVKEIGKYAFYSCNNLVAILIPDCVITIGDCAYYSCNNLTSITIGSGVTSIGGSAFRGCIGLTSITIPDSITEIGEDPFYNCSSLTYNEYDNAYYLGNANNPYVVLVHAKNTSITSCIVNDKTKLIYSNAFDGCSGLKSVTIPTSVTSIGDSAFRNCSSLTSITIPDSVTSIGDGAFYVCSSLTSITIPDSVTSIGYEAFKGCSNIKFNEYDNTYYLGNNNNLYVVLVKAKNTSITSCSINEKAKVIYSYAFEDCRGLTSITIPDSVTSIGGSAFRGCSSLTSITIPDSVTEIGRSAFSGCSSLTSITIPDSVTSIGDYAFSGCSSLTSITIPDSVTEIGWSAFENCSGLTSVTIGNAVTSIGSFAFSGCSSLTSITIPDSVTGISSFAFDGCYKLRKVYYKGSSFDWVGINISSPNSSLTNATRYYYSATRPMENGNYWHYDASGNVVEW